MGTMTGTSIDGDLDAAVVAVHGRGLSMRAQLLAHASFPLGVLADDLRRVAAQEPLAAGELARIGRAFGALHAEALAQLWSASLAARRAVAGEAGAPDLAVLHGQTVFHAPPVTWQLLDPWPVAVRLACRVRYDLRGANTASGGQGAPITPLADFILLGDDRAGRVVLNLGGFINATLVPPRGEGVDAVRGFDVCACNHLLDRVARTRLGAAFDAGGAAASRGSADLGLAGRISAAIAPGTDPSGAGVRRSLGTGDEAARLVELTAALPPDDACRTVVEAIADAAVRTIRAEARPGSVEGACEMLLAGGSARNAALAAALARRSATTVRTTLEAAGMPVEAREAAGMAVLGALADDGVRYALPQVTGARSGALDSALIEPA